MLPLALRQGLDTMVTGRPGPVNLDIPYNVFQEEAEVELPPRSHLDRPHRPGASDADVAAALDLLAAAHKPVFFIGHGATLSEAGPEISELAHRLGTPVITSPNGMGCVAGDDPLALGFIGRNGAYPANQAGRFADLVITLGTRFDDRSSSSWHPGYSWNFPNTRLLHVDIDPQELGRNYPPTLGLIADVKTFVRQLLNALPSRAGVIAPARYAPWGEQVRGWQARMGGLRAPPLRRLHESAASGVRGRHVAEAAARRRDPRARLGRAPQLVHAILAGVAAAEHAQQLGLFEHGLRRLRHPRRAARRARSALRRGGGRRRLHDGAATCCAPRSSTSCRWSG